jgi:hypothetical protein
MVAMTGNTSLQNIETYKNAGFCGVLAKPFDVVALQATLEAGLGLGGASRPSRWRDDISVSPRPSRSTSSDGSAAAHVALVAAP